MVRSRIPEKTLILRTTRPERAAELLAQCEELGYKAIVGVEPDKPEDITDLQRALQHRKTRITQSSFVPRNAPCPCGSGSKYKNCCGGRL